MNLFKILLLFIIFLGLNACGDGDEGKVSKGHRDAIKIQCEDTSNVKACGLELRENFDEDGNEYADFSELNDDQIDIVKFECVRSKKYGLVAYNDCLEKYIDKALGGDLFKDDDFAEKPKNNIEKLEASTVYIEMVYSNKKLKQELVFGGGSGVIISDQDIATNCHVAMANDPDSLKETSWNANDVERKIWVKTVNGKDWAEAKLIKKNEKKDICIVRHMPAQQFKIKMKPINKFKSFSKLKKGEFVRAIGSPGLVGHTSEGSIQWLGTMDAFDKILMPGITDFYDKDTKVIVHGARIHKGSSGGPLFDSDGSIIGLNTLGLDDSAAENIAVSSDHIKDLLYNN